MPNLIWAPHLGLPEDLFPIAPNWPILSRLPESSLRDAWARFTSYPIVTVPQNSVKKTRCFRHMWGSGPLRSSYEVYAV